jgi:Protein of unknwon function (DUF3008)
MDNFFHDINKRLNDIGSRQDLAESEKWIQKAVNPAHKGNLHRALHVPADKKIPAGKLEKATHSSNPKIKKQAVLAKTLRGLKESDPTDMNEADMDESALQAYLGKKKYGPEGMEALQKAGREHASKAKMDQIRNRYDKMDEADMVGLEEEDMEEGNEFSGARQAAIKAGKSSFSVDGKTYRVTGDTSDEEKMSEGYFKNLDIERQEREAKARHKGGLKQVPGMQNLKPGSKEHPLKNVAKGVKAFVTGKPEPMDEAKAKPDYIDLDHDGDKKETMKKAAADKKRSTGTAFDPDTRKHMKTDQEGTGKFDKKKISTGTVYTRRHSEDDEEQVKSDQPKRKGRPKGPAKGPERVTAKSYKYKQGRPVKEMEIPIINRGEYDQEGDEVKGDMHTVIRHAQELERHLRDGENLPTWVIEKVGQIKGMMTSISDYMLSQHERNAEHETGEEGIRIAEDVTVSTGAIQELWKLAMFLKGYIKDPDAMEAWKQMAQIIRGYHDSPQQNIAEKAVSELQREQQHEQLGYDSKLNDIAKKHGYTKKETSTGHTLTHPKHGTVEINHVGSYKIDKPGYHRQHGRGLGMLDTHLAHLNGTHPEDAKKFVKSLTSPATESVEITEDVTVSTGAIQELWKLATYLKSYIKDPDAMEIWQQMAQIIKGYRFAPQQNIAEKAVSVKQRRAAGIAHAAQKDEIPKNKLRGASRAMAQMPPGKLHKFAATKEKGLPKKVTAKKKEVDETTTAGSVATASNAVPKAKGMTFGKGVYEGAIAESFDKKLSTVLNEGMNVSLNMNAEGQKSINVSADGDDAEKLAEILKLAGLGAHAGACDSCGQSPCGCHEQVAENQPDWPTDTVTTDAHDPHLRSFSGGLNGPKSTRQTTIPVIPGQRGRMSTMEDTVALERSLFDLYKNYRAQ